MTAVFAPVGAQFRLGGRTLTGRPNLTPDVLAAWEDRYVDEPRLVDLIARTDRVLLLLIHDAHRDDYLAVRADHDEPVGIDRIAAVAEWLFEQDTLRSFRATRRLFASVRANWNQMDGYALAHGTSLERLGLRQLLNLTYWALADGSDEKERRTLDRNLETPERSALPHQDPGIAQLLQMMSGN